MQSNLGLRRPESLRTRFAIAVRSGHCLGHASDLYRAGYLRLDRLALSIVTRDDCGYTLPNPWQGVLLGC